MSTTECADDASASQGLPPTETSSVQIVEEMSVLMSNDANINVSLSEVAEQGTCDAIANRTDGNNSTGKVESFELPVVVSDGINEVDKEKNILENAEEEISTHLTPAIAEKKDTEAKNNDTEEMAERENDVKGDEKEVKVTSNNKNEAKAEKVEEGTVAVDDSDEQEKSKGFIFMCSAKTKKDCFDYKVFGLPEGRRDMVAKIYMGMKLFLYDIDLKLLYGIYEAVTPGGYNIEPNAFESKFPSQVRFNVVDDCLPLPEETFRNAIKENYFRKHKFHCLLSAEQVENMCELFKNAKISKSKVKRKAEERKAEASGSGKHRRKNVRNRRNTNRPVVHYRMGASTNPIPSHQSMPHPAAVPPPLPGYGYRGVDYYRREAPVERYGRDPYGYYREPVSHRDSPYAPSSSGGYYAAGPPRYRY